MRVPPLSFLVCPSPQPAPTSCQSTRLPTQLRSRDHTIKTMNEPPHKAWRWCMAGQLAGEREKKRGRTSGPLESRFERGS